MRVLFRSPMTPYTGYGQDGLGIAEALHEAGCHVMLDPAYVQPPWSEDMARLLTRPLEPPFDLYLCHADPGRVDISDAAAKNASVSMVWTMWEYTSFDNLDYRGRVQLLDQMTKFDVFACYDEPTQTSVEAYLDEIQAETRPLVVRQTGGYKPHEWSLDSAMPNDRRWEPGAPFRFCMVGQLNQRKDPFVAIKAFQDLKNDPDIEFEDAELHLKTNIPGLHPLLEQTPKLKIHYVTWPQDVLKAFMANCHVLLAPSRGEGKNMPALEMMTLGGTVIATNWGGHQSWMSSAYAYPLDYRLAPEPQWPDCMSARASGKHLKELMLHCYRNRDEVRRKGEVAARTIPKMQAWPSVLDSLFIKLSQYEQTRQLKYLWDRTQQTWRK